MTDIETRSVVVERDLPFSPEKVWRALLTQPHLIEEKKKEERRKKKEKKKEESHKYLK
jgi:hypothetical protein